MPSAALILADGFETIEALAAADVLTRAEFEVSLVGVSNINVKSAQNVPVVCSTTITEVANKTFDIVLIPGGHQGSVTCQKDQNVQSLIRKQKEQKKWIGAICAAPALVLGAEFMGDAKGVCYPGMEKDMGKSYVDTKDTVYVDADHKIITSKGPGTAICWSLKIVEVMKSKEKADEIKKALLY